MIVQESSINGIGLFAAQDYVEGYVVGIVDGPIVAYEEATDFSIEPKPGLYIETAAPFRFINHSCNPNVEILGERVVVATKVIHSGEELFLNYSQVIFDDWSMKCACGQPNCRRLINKCQ